MSPQSATPDIQFSTELRGIGRLECGSLGVDITRFRLTRTKYNEDEPWLFVGDVAREESDRAHDVVVSRSAPLQFRGETDVHKRLLIRSLNWTGNKSYTIYGEAYSVDFETEALAAPPTRAWLRVGLTDTSLARSEMLDLRPHSGEICGSGKEIGPLNVSLTCGKFAFSREYSFEQAHTSGLAALVRVDGPALSGQIDDLSLAQHPARLFDALNMDLLDLTRLLSFLSRQRVDWTSLKLSLRREGEPYFYADSERWHRASRSKRRSLLYPLVSPYRLGTDDLDAMYQRFRALPYKALLYSVIGFLITSQSDVDWLENKVFNAFTALEAVSAALATDAGETHTVSKRLFNQLRLAIVDVISAFATKENLSDDVRDSLCQKLGEINRRGKVVQMARAIQRHSVEWSDIWPGSSELSTELRLAYNRRSTLVHTGRLADTKASMLDYMRVHALTERLLYALVGGESQWLDPEAYRHLPPQEPTASELL